MNLKEQEMVNGKVYMEIGNKEIMLLWYNSISKRKNNLKLMYERKTY